MSNCLFINQISQLSVTQILSWRHNRNVGPHMYTTCVTSNSCSLKLCPSAQGGQQTGHAMSIASFPGSRAAEEGREPGTHCSCMLQVPLVTCILLRYTKVNGNFCLPAERPQCKIILHMTHLRAILKSKTISLCHYLSASLRSRQLVNFKGKNCVSHMP